MIDSKDNYKFGVRVKRLIDYNYVYPHVCCSGLMVSALDYRSKGLGSRTA